MQPMPKYPRKVQHKIMINSIAKPSPNFDSRNGALPTLLVLHYTGMYSGEAAIERLCDPAAKVSSHYVVEQDGRIFQLVDEAQCAWHAGLSSWRGVQNLNAQSVGIEIVNPGHEIGYEAFPAVQMHSVLELSQAIVARYNILPSQVVGHSDVAPLRKIDPGELFDWEWLAAHGVGQAVPQVEGAADAIQLWSGDSGAAVETLQRQLQIYGYGIDVTAVYDTQTEIIVSAFQRHFRRSLVTGIADVHTQAVLEALIAAE
jgi:N-acetylmuramoyl-L-alanine amidase